MHRDAQLRRPPGQRRVQVRTPHAQAGSVAEAGLGVPGVGGVVSGGGEVADAAQRVPGQGDAQVGESSHRARHQSFAAGLVDRCRPGLGHGHVESGAGGMDRGGESGGPSADDQQVEHDEVAEASGGADRASAAFSQRSRTARRGRLSRVKPIAVSHAPWTSGRASPSTTTAT